MDYASASYILTVGLILWLISVLSLWQVFVKAGYEGWKSIVPVYNSYILTKIANQPLWVFILLFFPPLNIISVVMVSLGISKTFGKGVGTALALVFFSFFGYMYLGWGQAEYQGEKQTA